MDREYKLCIGEFQISRHLYFTIHNIATKKNYKNVQDSYHQSFGQSAHILQFKVQFKKKDRQNSNNLHVLPPKQL